MEGIYVIELNTSAVKIGRSSDLPSRLQVHAGLCAQYAVTASQIWSAQTERSALAETRLIHLLWHHVTATPVSARETWTGVSFLEVVTLAAAAVKSPEFIEPPIKGTRAGYLLEALEILVRAADGSGLTKIPTAMAVERLDQAGHDAKTPRQLATLLGSVGLRTRNVMTQGRQAKGYDVETLRRERERLLQGGLPLDLSGHEASDA